MGQINKFKIIISISLIFFAGTLAGSLVTGKVIQNKIEKHWKGGRPFPIHRVMDRMCGDLRLTDAQRTDIETILKHAQEQLEAMRAKNQPEFQKIIDDVFNRIRQHLDADQQKRLEDMHRTFRFRFRKKGKNHRRNHGCMSPGHREPDFGDMADRLKLSPEKRERLRPVFEAADARRREACRRMRRRMMQELESELSSVLSSEEMKGFRTFMDKSDENSPGRSF